MKETVVVIIAIITFFVGFAMGDRLGLQTREYEAGVDFGTGSTLETVNHLLADAQTRYFVRYVDGSYHLVFKQKEFKREYPRQRLKDRVAPVEPSGGGDMGSSVQK